MKAKASAEGTRVERMSVVPDREGLAGAAHAFLATKPIGKVVLAV